MPALVIVTPSILDDPTMSFHRFAAHLLPALAYGGALHAMGYAFLLNRFHGYYRPEGWAYYFDIRNHHWPAFPISIAWFALLIVVPSVLALVVARRRPVIALEKSHAIIVHLVMLFFTLLLSGYFGFMAVLTGWNQSSF